MSTKSSSQLLHDHSNQYLLSKIDSSTFNSATSTLISSSEIVNRTSANSSSSCGYSLNNNQGSYLNQNEANMFNSANTASIISNNHNLGHNGVVTADGNFKKKKKKKKHRKSEKNKNNTENESSLRHSGPGNMKSSVYGGPSTLSHHHYPVHHYVQQTESVIISTRKLSVVESVSCPISQAGQYHPSLGPPTGSACHQSTNCNINYHHSSASLGGNQQSSLDDNYAMSQSTAISNILSQASSASSLNLHCQNEMANLSHQDKPTTRFSQKKKHKKKKKRRRDSVKYFSSSNISSQAFSNNIYCSGAESVVFDEKQANVASCDSVKCVSSFSDSSETSSSRTHSSCSSSSSSSSSDSEFEDANKVNKSIAYENYRRKVKQMKKSRPKSSFSSSTSDSSSGSSRSSSSSSSSSYSDSSSDDNAKSSSSSSASSSLTSRSATSSSKSSNLSAFKNADVLNQISVKSIEEVSIEPSKLTNSHNYYVSDATSIVNYVAQNSQVNNSVVSRSNETHLAHQFSPTFRGSSFSVDTLLQQEQPQTDVETNPTGQSSLSALPTQKDIASISLSKQNTPLSSIQSDDCNSIESPLSVESSGKESGKDESAKSNTKRRDPAEERQRLRSYRIPHHLSQNRTLSRSTDIASLSSSTSVKAVTSTACLVVPTVTTAVVTSSTSTTFVVTNADSGAHKTVSETPSVASSESRTTASTSQPKKERILGKVSQADNKSLQIKKPVAIVSSNSAKVTNPILAPSHQPSHFLNSSFFVPGATSTFPYPQHYPFSPAFMPALFQNQFLNSVASANSKVPPNVSASHARFLHQPPSQSQLTIFTSPNLGPNQATAHALSPFQFPGPMAHSALLSPTFSPSALSSTGATAPLLVPKSLNFSSNFSFSSGSTMDPTHPLMMFGIANSKALTSTSSTTSSTHPPFILPRIVSSSTTPTSITPTISKSSLSRSKSDRSHSQPKQTLIKSSLILSNTTSNCTMGTNSQHSPLSTILHPQTLLLLQPPITSPFPSKSVVSKSSSTSKSSVSSSDRHTLIASSCTKPTMSAFTSVDVTTPNLSSPKTPSTQTSIPATSLRPSTLTNSFILSPNSSHSHIPYTLFSPPHPQALMQPISIQAPPTPSPSSLLGTQLLLSVISPTHRNQLTSLGTQLKVPTSMCSVSTNNITTNYISPPSTSKSNELSKETTKPSSTKTGSIQQSTKSKSAVTSQSGVASSGVSQTENNSETTILLAESAISIASALPSKPLASSKSTVKDLFSNLNDTFYKDTRSTVYPTSQSNSTFSNNAPSSKLNRDSVESSNDNKFARSGSSKTMPYPFFLSKSSPGKNSEKTIKSPECIAASPNNDEFESLVQSVNDKIKSFHSSSEFYDDEEQVLPVKCTEKRPSDNSFNSKKMLSLMIGGDEKHKPTGNSGIAPKKTKSKDNVKNQKKESVSESKCLSELNHKVNKFTVVAILDDKVQGQSTTTDKPLQIKDKTHKETPKEKTFSRTHKVEKKEHSSKSHKKSTKLDKSTEKRKRKKRKEKRKVKAEKSSSKSLRKLDKKSSSRSKSQMKRSRKRTKQPLIKDPVLVSQIESLISQLTELHLSNSSTTLSTGATLPPMFRVCFPKATAKVTNRSGRTSGQRSKLLSGAHDKPASQCLLPLKKRQHRNLDDSTNLTNALNNLSSPKSENQTSRAKHTETLDISRPNSKSVKATKKNTRKRIKGNNDPTPEVKQIAIQQVKNISTNCNNVEPKQSTVGVQASISSEGISGTSANNLNQSLVAPPRDKRSSMSRAISPNVSAAISSRRQPHGVVATVEVERGERDHTASRLKQSKTVLSSEKAPLPPPLPSTTTSITAVQKTAATLGSNTNDHHLDRVIQTKATRGRKKKLQIFTSVTNQVPISNEIKVDTPSTQSNASISSLALTSDACKKNSRAASNNCSSLDESSDADDEFDSDDEGPSSKSIRLADSSLLHNKKDSFAQGLDKTPSKFQQDKMTKLPLDKSSKNDRLSGVHKHIDHKLKLPPTLMKKNVGIKKRGPKSSTSKVGNVSKKVSVGSSLKPDLTKSAMVKRKRRRTVNKTGFDKPKKRNKITNNAKIDNQITVNNLETNKSQSKHLLKSNDLNGYSSQSETNEITKKKPMVNKKTKKLKIDNCSTESSTEIDNENEPLSSISKLKRGKGFTKKYSHTKLTQSNKTNKKAIKISNSDSSDSERLQATSLTSSALSQDEEENDTIPLSVDDYPVFMVTKPSNKHIKSKKKLHQIKTNPFIRPIPSKKYYKTAFYSSAFSQTYPDESQTCITATNLVKETDQTESKPEMGLLPILPFPPFFALNDLISTSSSASSQEEDDLLSTIDQEIKLPKRLIKHGQNESNEQALKLLENESGFTLNFDIWYQYKFNPLPGPMSSANYRRVRQNTFLDTKPVAKHSHQSCNCNRPKNNAAGCGSDCINRLMYQECWPQTCPCGMVCSNQRIQRYEWSLGLERFMTAKRGWGIRTTETIKSGEFILEYIGEIASDRLFQKRMTVRYGNDQHHYSLKIDAGMVIDGYRVANEGRFVNHSCEPNCEMQKWAVNGYFRVCMFALRDIKPNEELFYDYNFHNFNSDSQQTCHCGSSKCRGIIGGKKAIQKVPSIDSGNLCDVSNLSENSKDLKIPSDKTILSKKKHQPNESLFMKCKKEKAIIPVSQIKNIFGAKFKERPRDSEFNVEVRYDSRFLEIFPKLKQLSHSNEEIVQKSGIFLLRNYRNSRRVLTRLSIFLQGPSDEKLVLDSNPYLKQKFNYRNSPFLKNGISSEIDTNDCNYRPLVVNPSMNVPFDNSQIILKVVKHANLCIDMCFSIRAFVKEKLDLLLKVKDNLNIGDICSLNGTLKRPLNRLYCESSFADSLFTFKPILNQIKAIPFIRMELLETEMINYIQNQLEALCDFEDKNVLHKKVKLSSHKSKVIVPDNKSIENNDLYKFMLDNEQIKTFGQNIFIFFKCIMKDKKCHIDEIMQQTRINYYFSISTLIKHMNKLENNNLHLSEINLKKLALFIKKLPVIKLSNIFESDHMNTFDLISKINDEVERQANNLIEKIDDDLPIPKLAKKVEDDIVKCICGITREEGKMIQCESCEIWQHFDCVEQFCHISNDKNFVYFCENCQKRNIPSEIPLPLHHYPSFDVNKQHPMKYFITLQSPVVPDLRIKTGDCVYIYRKSSACISLQSTSNNKKKQELNESNEDKSFIDSITDAANAGMKNANCPFDKRQCIIIRVQNLAIIESTNQRILYGHHYLWPSETYHEPNRMFHPKEVLRSPLCEWAALEEVKGLCCVLDPKNFIKGRPKYFKLEDVFLCEYRVDRAAKAFNKIANHGIYQVNTKQFAFETFKEKKIIRRNYSPHDIPKEYANKAKKGKKDDHTQVKKSENDLQKDRKDKIERLLNVANRLNECVYYWILLLEQEQNKYDPNIVELGKMD